ncbi:MAG: hypothetical protein QF578_09760 [Alphaproteobacteria bacterium]|jgi:hypothetical protein|nr:hypothetical protein [Alphaproteobacteria bacterium]
MLKAITEEVSARQRPVTGYDREAGMHQILDRQQKPVSLALNQLV